jgi:hypothetical protein
MTLESIGTDDVVKVIPGARERIGRCWCDDRVRDREMDSELAEVFAELLSEYMYALVWCGGAPAFSHDGEAKIGYDRVCRPLLD